MIVTGLDVAGFPVAQFICDVSTHVTISLFDGGDNEGEQLIGLAGVNYRKGRLSVVPNGLISYTTEGEGTSQQEAFTTLGFETTVGFEILPDLTVTGSGLVAHVFEHEVMPGLDTSANGFGFAFGLTYAAGGLF